MHTMVPYASSCAEPVTTGAGVESVNGCKKTGLIQANSRLVGAPLQRGVPVMNNMALQRFFVLLCAVARRARAAVAFVTPANTANAAPAAVALLRVRRFVPSSSGFFVVARPSTITSLRASHLRRFFDGDGPLDTLAVDVTRTEMLVALARLRSSAQMKSFLRGAPWPLEMFFWAVAPQKLADRGFEHTVALDADVFAMDGQIIDVLPTVRGIGIVRIFPKECYTAAMPASKARLPAFVPPLVDAVKIAAAPHAFAHRDGTNSGVIVFNNSRMVAAGAECTLTFCRLFSRGGPHLSLASSKPLAVLAVFPLLAGCFLHRSRSTCFGGASTQSSLRTARCTATRTCSI